jgi:ketosteroid isomerase-like protein
MGEHANVALVRRMIESLNHGDMQALVASLADDVEWHEIGRSEARHGKSALRDALSGGPDYQITATLHDVIGNDDHTVALLDVTATRGGRTLAYRVAEIYHIRDGLLVERWAFSDDTAAIAAFFA